MEATEIYPLGGQAKANPMQFPEASGFPVNMLRATTPARSISSKPWSIPKARISPIPAGWACWPR
jgi:hypothetical protein